MTDVAVIILAKNEKLHIKRCLEKLKPLEPRQVFVVDCFSTDGTQDIAEKLGATVVEHEWLGLYAKQFNWALDNLPIAASWMLWFIRCLFFLVSWISFYGRLCGNFRYKCHSYAYWSFNEFNRRMECRTR